MPQERFDVLAGLEHSRNARQQLVVMTGGTSGIGKAAYDKMAAEPGVTIIQGARSILASDGNVHRLDLADLGEVRAFADAVVQSLSDRSIDALILNAGINFSRAGAVTNQGYERTFGVNHLAHYLLLRRLAPYLAKDGRVVITTSDAHDPAINRVAPPVHADVSRYAFPNSDKARPSEAFKQAMYAYSGSKLFNLLTARTFSQLPETVAKGITVVAYNPGLTLGTQLGRSMPIWQSVLLRAMGMFLIPLLRLSSVATAGNTLAALALGKIVPPDHRLYASMVRRRLTWPEPSTLARTDGLGREVWDGSARLAGIVG